MNLFVLVLLGTPGAPQQVQLKLVGQININVTWLPPEVDGNVEIESYTVSGCFAYLVYICLWSTINASWVLVISSHQISL